ALFSICSTHRDICRQSLRSLLRPFSTRISEQRLLSRGADLSATVDGCSLEIQRKVFSTAGNSFSLGRHERPLAHGVDCRTLANFGGRCNCRVRALHAESPTCLRNLSSTGFFLCIGSICIGQCVLVARGFIVEGVEFAFTLSL